MSNTNITFLTAWIAFEAGQYQYYTGDRKTDVEDFIIWATEFESIHGVFLLSKPDDFNAYKVLMDFVKVKFNEVDPNFSLYKSAGTYLSDSEKTLKENVEDIIQNFIDGYGDLLIDDVADIAVWQPFENRFTCTEFLEKIGYNFN